MEEFNFQGFNTCKKHLSPLGNQILNVMIKHLKKERNKYQRIPVIPPPPSPPPPPRERRILSFNPEPETQISWNQRQPPAGPVRAAPRPRRRQHADADAVLGFTRAPPPPPPPHVPASAQLPKSPSHPCAPAQHDIQVDCTREELLNIPTDPHSISSQASAMNVHSGRNIFKSVSVSPKRNKSENINWDDMFDSEILPELPVADDADAISYIALSEHKHNALATCAIDSDTSCPQKQTTGQVPKKSGVEIISDIQIVPPRKRKNAAKDKHDTSKKLKTTAKKIKKNNEIKDILKKEISYKKPNYNVAVQKWLNEVNPEHAAELDDTPDARRADESRPPLAIDTSARTKTCKKAVQCKLVNKDGVMKYANETSAASHRPAAAAAAAAGAAARTTKLKPKFVAPIKSQTPVKDVTYDIIDIDDTNVSSLCQIKEESVEMILIYRDGSCQLDGQPAEEACGALLRAAGTTYCLGAAAAAAAPLQRAKACLERLLAATELVCYEGKRLLGHLARRYHIDLLATEMRIMDVKIGGSLLEPDSPPADWAQLQRLVGWAPGSAEGAAGTACARQRAAGRCAALRPLAAALRAALRAHGLWALYETIEGPLVPIIADMECRGVAVDGAALAGMEARLRRRLRALERRCHQAAGRAFQLTSAPQVRAVLYDELRLDAQCNVAIRGTLSTGAKSTSESMLRRLAAARAHPLPALVLAHRRAHKALAALSGVALHVRDGVVRPTWLQAAAATGRIACSSPNLQAIPKEPFPLDEAVDGDTAEAPEAEGGSLSFRSVYVARAGRVLLAGDFRHVECRLLAAAAGDARLRAALAQPDLFRTLAAQWLRTPPALVTPAQRERTKRVLYAAVYGAGAARLAAMLQVPHDEALATVASFNSSFPSLRAFGSAAVSRCAAGGGRLRTGAGRARSLPDIAAPDAARRTRAERQALNFLVQGAAADVCKAAMAGAVRALRAAAAAAGGAPRARLLLQIHDELVWEVPQAELLPTAEVIRAAMEQCGAACGLALTLPVALSAGPSWGELRPLPDPAPATAPAPTPE